MKLFLYSTEINLLWQPFSSPILTKEDSESMYATLQSEFFRKPSSTQLLKILLPSVSIKKTNRTVKIAYSTPDISLHSGPLLSAASNVISQTGSMNMFPQGNRHDGNFHSQQAQWAQYQRSLSSTPEDPYQRRSQESSLTPPAGYASLPSQQAMFSNTSYPIGMQQPMQAPPSQAFYPT